MIKITKYESYDGCEFNTKEECREYEDTTFEVNEIMENLCPSPEGCDFSNGSGYIQHNMEDVKLVKSKLIKLAGTTHTRELYEFHNCAFRKAWFKISCIDSQAREWGQIYFVEHSHEAEQTCLNGGWE